MLGGLCWSTLFTLLGYFFGGIPAVQKHFELVIIAILVLSLIPTIVGLLKAKFGKKKPAAEDTAETADANKQRSIVVEISANTTQAQHAECGIAFFHTPY